MAEAKHEPSFPGEIIKNPADPKQMEVSEAKTTPAPGPAVNAHQNENYPLPPPEGPKPDPRATPYNPDAPTLTTGLPGQPQAQNDEDVRKAADEKKAKEDKARQEAASKK